jgi:phosphate uptake regulator
MLDVVDMANADEPRRIQRTGRNTFIISLPYAWVMAKGLNKGDSLYISDNGDGSLTMAPKKSNRSDRKYTITASSTDSSSTAYHESMRNIVAAYVSGAGSITLRGEGTNTLAEEARRILSGVEISEENGNELTLQILTFENLSVDGIMKRLFNVTSSMFDLAIAIANSGKDLSIEISRKEDDVDRLYILLLRNLCTGNYPAGEPVFRAIAAKSMEKISDHLEDFSENKSALPNAQISGLLEKAFEVYSAAFESFSSGEHDSKEFSNAINAFYLDYESIDKVLKKEKNQSNLLALKSLSEKCKKIVKYSEDIMESGEDLSFSK